MNNKKFQLNAICSALCMLGLVACSSEDSVVPKSTDGIPDDLTSFQTESLPKQYGEEDENGNKGEYPLTVLDNGVYFRSLVKLEDIETLKTPEVEAYAELLDEGSDARIAELIESGTDEYVEQNIEVALEKAIEDFVADNGRAPTDAEIEVLREQAVSDLEEQFAANIESLVAETIELEVNEFSINLATQLENELLYDGYAKDVQYWPTPQALADLPEGEDLTGNDAYFTVSGLDQFSDYGFNVTSPDLDRIPNPDMCPGEDNRSPNSEFFLVENPAETYEAQLIVIPKEGNYQTLAKNATSVVNEDRMFMQFSIPNNRYGMSFEAALDYPGGPFLFQATTPDADYDQVELQTPVFDTTLAYQTEMRMYPDEEHFNFSALNFERGIPEDPFTEEIEAQPNKIVPNTVDQIAVSAKDDTGVINATTGSTYIFYIDEVVAGMSPFVKSSNFDFYPPLDENGDVMMTTVNTLLIDELTVDGDSVYQERTEPVAQVHMVGGTIEGMYDSVNYGQCAAQEDVMMVRVSVPEDAYGTDLVSKLVWNHYEDVDGIRTKISKEFMFSFRTENPHSFDLDAANQMFADLAPEPGSTIEIDQPFETQVPVNITVPEGVSYSINGGEFTTEPGILNPGDTLALRVTVAGAMEPLPIGWKEYTDVGFTVTYDGDKNGEISETETYTYAWKVRNQANPDEGTVLGSIAFPPKVSATDSSVVTFRGEVSLSKEVSNKDDDADLFRFNDSNLKVILVGTDSEWAVDVEEMNSIEGVSWTASIDLSDLNAQNESYQFQLVSNQFDTTTYPNLGPALAEESYGEVGLVKQAGFEDEFPEGVGTFASFVDISVDGRSTIPVLHVAEMDTLLVYTYPLVSAVSDLALTNTLKVAGGNDIKGVQVNNYAFDNIYATDEEGQIILYKTEEDGETLAVDESGEYILDPDSGVPLVTGTKPQEIVYTSGYGHRIDWTLVPGTYDEETVTDTVGVAWEKNSTKYPYQMAIPESGDRVYLSGSLNTGSHNNVALNAIWLDENNGGQFFTNADKTEDPTTATKLVSNEFTMSYSVDVFSTGEADARKEYAVVLTASSIPTGKNLLNPTGANELWVVEQADKATHESGNTNTFQLDLMYDDGTPVLLTDATSVAIDDEREKAYVCNALSGNELMEFDLDLTSQTATGRVLMNLEGDRCTSIVKEGGLPYLIAADADTNAILAVDPVTAEQVILLQAGK
ncbi:hypothetical protein [Echinimonas agarilytica]|uniref:Uncharacterized protein n=1 Tax=Echinimonas agarilytica TaxID=1215918 RepID=A0AA42B6E6_9GAMM|nr:hypothetical protein [Echinimonas agarilytica]MCM2678715.1 hypothetical protein [Echinimonas agarilytica]